MSQHRWQAGEGPAKRRLRLSTRLKSWLVELATRDRRVRRMALSRIFSGHVAPGVLCLVPFDDYKVYVDPRDDRIAFTLLSGRHWQRAHLERALTAAAGAGRLQPDGLFVDVGANIGLMTLYAMLSGRFRHAIAIEPDPWNRTILQENLAINGLAERVTVVGKAASDSAGTMVLHRDARNLGAHSLEPGFSMTPVGEAQSVAVGRLDDILADAGVDLNSVAFVKIDVEGHEFATLAGMPATLAVHPPLMIEVTFDTGDGGRADGERLQRLLAGYAMVLDIECADAASAVPIEGFKPTGSQHELLVY